MCDAYAFRRVLLETPCLSDLADFYGHTLGLEVALQGSRLRIQAGASQLEFEENSESEAAYHFAFEIPRNRVQEARDWLAARVPILKHDGLDVFRFESWDAEAVYFVDPAGNVGEFIGRQSVSNSAEEPFCPESILAVSELGIPVPNVSAAAETIHQEIGWLPFRPPALDFAAIGDEFGLWIVVSEGRPWFPTESRTARAYPAEVELYASETVDFQVHQTRIHGSD